MQLIVLAGQARVGKTTLAKIIAEGAFNLGMKPELLSFAGPLKKLAEEKGYAKDTEPKKYRDFCQSYGAMKREIDPDYWVNEFEKELQEHVKTEQRAIKDNEKYWERCIIVDDCRYLNEVGLAMKHNATLIFVSFGDREMPDSEAELRDHHSEKMARLIDSGDKDYIDVFPYVITNDGNEKDLKEQAQDMIPVWCGVEPAPKQGKRLPDVEEAVELLIDILFLNNIDEEEEEEDEHDDEETE